jgi:hypothetical protein
VKHFPGLVHLACARILLRNILKQEHIDILDKVLYQDGFDPPEEGWADPAYRQMPVLLYVERCDAPGTLRGVLLSGVAGIRLLERQGSRAAEPGRV